MKLKPIFVNDVNEGLHCVHYDGQYLNEYDRLFELWTDTQYLTEYFISNAQYLQTGFFSISVDEAITKILDEAEKLENLIDDYSDEGFQNKGNNLQMLFLPLKNTEYKLPEYQETKAKIAGPRVHKPMLRVYAIRLGVNTFVITGGAIKLTHLMMQHPDTKEELNKILEVKTFLKREGILIEDDLNYYYG
jgi:hypothetical protein